jgi:hypothetical protein
MRYRLPKYQGPGLDTISQKTSMQITCHQGLERSGSPKILLTNSPPLTAKIERRVSLN